MCVNIFDLVDNGHKVRLVAPRPSSGVNLKFDANATPVPKAPMKKDSPG